MKLDWDLNLNLPLRPALQLPPSDVDIDRLSDEALLLASPNQANQIQPPSHRGAEAVHQQACDTLPSSVRRKGP